MEILLCGLNDETSPNDIKKIFIDYGDITRCVLFSDNDSGTIAFVNFINSNDAKDAVKHWTENKFRIKDSFITVKMATDIHHLIDPRVLKNSSNNPPSTVTKKVETSKRTRSSRRSRSRSSGRSSKSSMSFKSSRSSRRSRSRSSRRSRSRSSGRSPSYKSARSFKNEKKETSQRIYDEHIKPNYLINQEKLETSKRTYDEHIKPNNLIKQEKLETSKRTYDEHIKPNNFIKQENLSFYNNPRPNNSENNYFDDDKENTSNSILDSPLIKNADSNKKHKNMQSTIIRSPSPKTRIERYTKDNADDCSWSSESPEQSSKTISSIPANESFKEITGHLMKT